MTVLDGVSSQQLKEVYQKIKAALIFEDDLDLDPKLVKHLFVSNLIQRSLARMYGESPSGPKAVKVTEDGSIAVVQRGGAFDDYERLDHAFAALITSTTDGTTADKLVDSTETFVTKGVAIGDTVKNTTDTTYALVTAIDSETQLSLDTDIMTTGENYEIIPFKEFTFSLQVNRVDLFTYLGDVDYQLTRDQVKPYGDKIELFTDSFYSLDFYTLKVKATAVTFDSATPTKSKVVGWFREGG